MSTPLYKNNNNNSSTSKNSTSSSSSGNSNNNNNSTVQSPSQQQRRQPPRHRWVRPPESIGGDFDRDRLPHFGGGFGGREGGSLMGPGHPIFGGRSGGGFPGRIPGARFDPYVALHTRYDTLEEQFSRTQVRNRRCTAQRYSKTETRLSTSWTGA